MDNRKSHNIDVALVHYPVIDKTGDIVSSAVTNLDLHDIARAGCTYGIGTYWVVLADEMQQDIASKIVGHWTEGYGGKANVHRKNALSLVRICSTLDEVIRGIAENTGEQPYIIATCAQHGKTTIDYSAVRKMGANGRQLLLLFGTAWGMAPEILHMADGILPPLRGAGEYNHLSVRSAVSIILDRLLAPVDER